MKTCATCKHFKQVQLSEHDGFCSHDDKWTQPLMSGKGHIIMVLEKYGCVQHEEKQTTEKEKEEVTNE